MELYGVYNPLSGITTNQSEGFNSVLKRLQGWKEVPVDTAVLKSYITCKCTIGMSGKEDLLVNKYEEMFIHSIIILLLGLGEYELSKQFSSLRIPIDEMNVISTTCLDDTIKNLKDGVMISGVSDEETSHTE